jgi:hypothetical protein
MVLYGSVTKYKAVNPNTGIKMKRNNLKRNFPIA